VNFNLPVVLSLANMPKTNMEQHKILFIDHAAVMGGAELSLLDLATAYAQTSKVLLFSGGPLQNRLEKAGIQCLTSTLREDYNPWLKYQNSGIWQGELPKKQ
jgi:hypothetical protein